MNLKGNHKSKLKHTIILSNNKLPLPYHYNGYKEQYTQP